MCVVIKHLDLDVFIKIGRRLGEIEIMRRVNLVTVQQSC